ncbi:Uncharacterised protein [Vibrio cholerae]|nr:Uncharacterised protein [Vibrio cholerae]
MRKKYRALVIKFNFFAQLAELLKHHIHHHKKHVLAVITERR